MLMVLKRDIREWFNKLLSDPVIKEFSGLINPQCDVR